MASANRATAGTGCHVMASVALLPRRLSRRLPRLRHILPQGPTATLGRTTIRVATSAKMHNGFIPFPFLGVPPAVVPRRVVKVKL